jgi:hypothetical protein
LKIAIVGTSRDINIEERLKLIEVLSLIHRNNPNAEFISGGASGVDSIAHIYLHQLLGAPFKNYYPNKEGWEGNSERNIIIAKECDKLYCFTTRRVINMKCYHHHKTQDHQKTAGCWTLREAKNLDKETHLIII